MHEYYARKRKERLGRIEQNFPAEMKDLPFWAAYKVYRGEDGKKKKVIKNCLTDKWASSQDKNSCVCFEAAKEYALEKLCEGLSFSLKDSGITCIDLDGCIDEQGQYSELSQQILSLASNTFAERSVSGKGVHVFLKGNFMQGYRTRTDDGLECFDNKFISVTGDVISATKDIKEPSPELVEFLKEKLGKKPVYTTPAPTYKTSAQSDADVIKKISRSRVGKTFQALYNGDIGGYGNDHSRADLRLVGILVFFTDGDEQQVKRIFESSGLYRPQKGEDYVKLTIQTALKTTTLREHGDH